MTTRTPDVSVLFEDVDLIAVDKPAGLPTANAPRGTDSLFTRLVRRAESSATPAQTFVGIVSRLDAPVSGVVVVARSPAAAADLAEQFRTRSVTKEYAALVTGRFPAPVGEWREWHDAVARDGDERRSRVRLGEATPTVDDGPAPAAFAWQEARLRARVACRGGEVSLVELEPATGRRHQLRAQLAAHGCPIVGDRTYGSRLPFPGGIALHARRLTILHPRTGAALQFTAAWPSAWVERYRRLVEGAVP